MRLIGVVIAIAAALAAAVFAFAGSSGAAGGRSAFALVDPNGGSPRLVAGHTSGFAAISSPFPGDYCLTPASGVDVVDTAAVASQEAFYSNVVGDVTVRYDPTHMNCSPAQLEVKTFVSTPEVGLSDEISFTINVP